MRASTTAEAEITLITLADFDKEVASLPSGASAGRLAEQLSKFDQVRLSESERAVAIQRVDELAKRLRVAVTNEARVLQEQALKAPTYAEGSSKARAAGAIIALYPLSDDQKSLDEAASLANAQAYVMTQLGLIRRKRYNLWAIESLQEAQRLIDSASYPISPFGRDQKIELWQRAQSMAVARIKYVEPSMLEPAVASLYQELLSQIGKEDKEYRKKLFKQIVDPSVQRKILEDF